MSPKSSQSQAGTAHETTLQVSEGGWSWAVSHGAGERQMGTPCRVRLNIYSVGYGRAEGEGEKSREREKNRRGEEEKWEEPEAASARGRWKRKRLRLHAERKICLPQRTGK